MSHVPGDDVHGTVGHDGLENGNSGQHSKCLCLCGQALLSRYPGVRKGGATSDLKPLQVSDMWGFRQTKWMQDAARSGVVTVAQIEAAVPDLAAACALTGRFANMVRNGEHDNLEEWLSEAGDSLLASLARGLNADKHAVLAALREPWSNRQTEGQINKLKALKRQMYGRANLDLLRARLVTAA